MKLALQLFTSLTGILLLAICVSATVTSYKVGNPADVSPQLHGQVLNLGGGGTDVDPAIQWMIDKVRGCSDCATKVDVVILRASGADGYNAPILAMNGVDSVETHVITARKDALNQPLIASIQNAEVIFFAGGDQCDYVQLFARTRIERAVKSVYSRGGAVGGTSAGLAVQGENIYDGCTGSSTSTQALLNPYHSSISFTREMFRWNDLAFTMTDSHFEQRDRMGRLFAFLARHIGDGIGPSILGIAVNERTSVVVDQAGIARVMGLGNGKAYFVLADHLPETCVPGSALTYSNFKIWRVSEGGTFDLRNRPSNGFYTVSVSNGSPNINPY